ncbi:MAG: trehalose-6-phosphate synthase [Acidobacteria bacterium]|nr:trehalose-6-phosphate synthase [Acidobacteriota bacterium]
MMQQLTADVADARTDAAVGPWLRASCANEQVIVLANRQPFRHDYDRQGGIVVRHSHSGVVNAVEPLLSACSGVWVAHGGGTADRAAVGHRDSVEVPPGNPAYRLRRVWLDEREERGYYDGFANEALWPLCHRAYVKPIFRTDDFNMYRTVNERFADAVRDEAISESPLVLVQDYHFALAPQLIRERLRRSVIVTFWHIPWPPWQDLEVCPWGRHLLEGVLGSNIVGFQTPSDCGHFIEAVDRSLEAQIDHDRHVITYAGRRVLVRAYPVSIEWPSQWAACSPSVETCRKDVRAGLRLRPDVRLGVGVDRMDYTKGLEEKFGAIERLLDRYPELRNSFAFVQLAQPTRARLPAYRELRARLMTAVERINRRFGGAGRGPITLLEGDHAPQDVFRYLRAADLCYVASLHDGMNLVSKEFVGAREDEQGVLVLSRFAGAAGELGDALIVNPLDLDGTADALAQALRMDQREQRKRMRNMRAVVARSSAYTWAGRIVSDAERLRDARHGGTTTVVGLRSRPLSRQSLTFGNR